MNGAPSTPDSPAERDGVGERDADTGQMTATLAPTSGGVAVRVERDRTWLMVFLAGLGAWLLAAAITSITRDNILVPTVILLGSFLVPVTVVTWALGLPRAGGLTSKIVFLAFLSGGTLGVLASALVETYVLTGARGTYFGVGLIEEGAKALVLLAVAHQVVTRGPRDGMVLGAIVGAGFAAFESSGYAFSAIIDHVHDHEVVSILQTEFTRALLAPFGHILWTSLVGGALFAGATAKGHFRLTRNLVLTFIGVVLLHMAWDSSYGFAIVISRGFVGEGWIWSWPSIADWIGAPTKDDLIVFNVAYDGLLVLNAAIGSAWVVHEYRRHTRLLESGEERVVTLQ